MASAGSSGGQGTAAPTRRFSLFLGGDNGAMDDSSEDRIPKTAVRSTLL